MYNGAGVQGTVAVLQIAGNQGRRQPPHSQLFDKLTLFKGNALSFSKVNSLES